MKYLFITLLVLSSITTSFGQDLLKERIRKLTTNKTSVYVEKGVFHNGANKTESSILSIRQNYSDKQGYERIVFDFSTNKVPKVYGYISSETQKISIDFFDTKINPNIKTIKNTKFLEKVNFYPIEADHISVDMILNKKAIADVFILENPGRLVIDLKN